jgi:phosphoesterase RecJ-like protein
MAQGLRPERVGEEIREELASLLARDVHDPGIGFVTLTRVKVSPDLQLARVFYTLLGDERAHKETEKALTRATPFLRRQIGARIRLRRVPELRFEFDRSVENQDRIERILIDLQTEREARAAAQEEAVADPAAPASHVSLDAGAIADALRERQSFILTSHARPDGDAVGSQLALAFALRALGKTVRVVDKDPVPGPYREFPGVADIELAGTVTGDADAVVTLECSDLDRPGVGGLDQYFVINIDHHLGNEMYGQVNWFDLSAASCTEMVADVIDSLGVAWTAEIATHLYLGIVTDTGGFRHGPISARTFELARRVAETGINIPELSRRIFDSFSIGRVKLTGAMLSRMELRAGGRLAVLEFDDALLAASGATIDDTEGLVNLPLGAEEVQAVVLFKPQSDGTCRISLRSKDAVDVRAVAAQWKGGGHKNAAGVTIEGPSDAIRRDVVAAVEQAIDAAQ